MKRITAHIDFLDYFRAAAIIAVFLFHSLGTAYGYDQLPWGNLFRDLSVRTTSLSFVLMSPLTLGWAGVAIFFAVSGFCIHLSYIRNPQQGWVSFFTRRFYRIYPPYMVALIIFGLILPLLGAKFVQGFSRGQLFTHTLLIHNFWERTLFGINPALWSIAVEVQLYALFPFLLILIARWGWQRSLFLIGSIEIALRLWQGIHLTLTDTSLPTFIVASPFIYWFSWSIGAWLADAYVNGYQLPFVKTSVFGWLFLAVLTNFIKPLSDLPFLFFALFTVTWMAKLLSRSEQSPPLLHSDTLKYTGIWSYSIYLIHQPILAAVLLLVPLLPRVAQSPPMIFLLCVAAAIVIAVLSFLYYRTIEVPSMALGKRVAIRRFSKATASLPR